jgi:hypothetical protein
MDDYLARQMASNDQRALEIEQHREQHREQPNDARAEIERLRARIAYLEKCFLTGKRPI